jgi:DNA-binding NtrC family response regulator
MAAKSSGGNIFGMPIWNSLRDICRDACLKFAISATRTKAEAASFLGINISTLKTYIKKYDIKSYFEDRDETK